MVWQTWSVLIHRSSVHLVSSAPSSSVMTAGRLRLPMGEIFRAVLPPQITSGPLVMVEFWPPRLPVVRSKSSRPAFDY